MPYQIPTFSPPKKGRPKRKKKSLDEALGLKTVKSPEKQAPPPTPSSQMGKWKPRKKSVASGLSQAAMAMPGRGKASRILKGALAGAAAGAELGSLVERSMGGG